MTVGWIIAVAAAFWCVVGGVVFLYLSAVPDYGEWGKPVCEDYEAPILKKLPTGEPGNPFRVKEIKCEFGKMYDAGRGLFTGNIGRFFWINDRQVIFRAANTRHGPLTTRDRKEGVKAWIYVWDLDKGISKFRDLQSPSQRICFRDGFLSVMIKRDFDHEAKKLKGLWYFEGRLGNEQRVFRPPRKSGTRWNHLTCRDVERPAGTKGRSWAPLRQGDGYLDFGLSVEIRKRRTQQWEKLVHGEWMTYTDPLPELYLTHKISAQGIVRILPIPSLEASATCARYMSFQKSYFLYNCGGDRRKWHADDCVPYWWYRPNGRADRHCAPGRGVWSQGGDFSMIPMKTGLLLWSNAIESATQSGGRVSISIGRESSTDCSPALLRMAVIVIKKYRPTAARPPSATPLPSLNPVARDPAPLPSEFSMPAASRIGMNNRDCDVANEFHIRSLYCREV